ncbi:unannotated protein [freshwater metagenome]|uniref:Unannotated protein n=1 Tax=freshwater metagenome TaxID=449393 RepID=A0A6J6W0N6_9ZZZZ
MSDRTCFTRSILGAKVGNDAAFGGAIEFVNVHAGEEFHDPFLQSHRQSRSVEVDGVQAGEVVFGQLFWAQSLDHGRMRGHQEDGLGLVALDHVKQFRWIPTAQHRDRSTHGNRCVTEQESSTVIHRSHSDGATPSSQTPLNGRGVELQRARTVANQYALGLACCS